MKAQLIVTAAGLGTRLGTRPGAATPKALVPIGGCPLLVRTLRAFAEITLAGPAVVTAPPGYESRFAAALEDWGFREATRIVTGGAERHDSVGRGLAALDDDTAIVVIHDAARPFVSVESIAASIAAAVEYGAATVAFPCTDTILLGDGEENLVETPDRSRLWSCQTPQTFRVDVIRAAYAAAAAAGRVATDDATLARENGARVRLVPGTTRNFKITTGDDLAYAEYLFNAGAAPTEASE